MLSFEAEKRPEIWEILQVEFFQKHKQSQNVKLRKLLKEKKVNLEKVFLKKQVEKLKKMNESLEVENGYLK